MRSNWLIVVSTVFQPALRWLPESKATLKRDASLPPEFSPSSGRTWPFSTPATLKAKGASSPVLQDGDKTTKQIVNSKVKQEIAKGTRDLKASIHSAETAARKLVEDSVGGWKMPMLFIPM